MAMPNIVVYTTAYCPYCLAAKDLLTKKGVSFEEIKVDGDRAARLAMSQRAQGRTTVPQIFVGETHVGGCDDLFALDRSGKLNTLLQGEPV